MRTGRWYAGNGRAPIRPARRQPRGAFWPHPAGAALLSCKRSQTNGLKRVTCPGRASCSIGEPPCLRPSAFPRCRLKRCACPPSWQGSSGWPTTPTGPGIRSSAILYNRIDRATWRRVSQPGARAPAAAQLVDHPRRPGLHGPVPHAARRVRRVHGQRPVALVRAPPRRRPQRAGRLLLRRVRPPRVARHLLGRPRRPGRRPLQGRLGHGAAVRGGRALLSPRLLPPDDRRGRSPGARLPGPGPAAPAAPARRRTRMASRSWSPSSCPAAPCTSASGSSQVGRVPLLLLDTDIPENDGRRTGRSPTSCTSAGARCASTRSSCSASAACARCARSGIEPAAWHLNEGHSAFMLVEQTRELIARAASRIDEALDRVRSGTVFTIHTPVSAGNERFDADLVRRVAGPLAETRPGPRARLELGRGVDNDPQQFDMTAFSLRLSNDANAVSQLHAETANATWQRRADEAHPGDHQRRPRPDLAGRPVPATCTRTSARISTAWTTSDPRTASGSGSSGSPIGACGTRTCSRSWSWPTSRAAGCGRSSRATARRPTSLRDSRRPSTRRS